MIGGIGYEAHPPLACPHRDPVGLAGRLHARRHPGQRASRAHPPSPRHVWRVARSGELWTNIEVSAWRALVGFAIGGGIGFTLGMLNGLSSLSETLTDSTLQMVRNIPHLALIPLVILWFGIDEEAKIFLVALGVFFPIYVNTRHGVRSVDPHLLEMGRAYGMSRTRPLSTRRAAGFPAIDFRRPTLRPRHHVAHVDRR